MVTRAPTIPFSADPYKDIQDFIAKQEQLKLAEAAEAADEAPAPQELPEEGALVDNEAADEVTPEPITSDQALAQFAELERSIQPQVTDAGPITTKPVEDPAMAALAEQKAGLENLKKLAVQQQALAAGGGQQDISAILATSDLLAGTKFLQNYQKPMTQAERAALASKLEEQVQKHRGEITRSQAAIDKSKAVGSRRETKDLIKNKQDLFRDFKNNKQVTAAETAMGAAAGARKLIDAGGPIGGQAAKTQLARLSGEVGALSDTDVRAYAGSQAPVDRLMRVFEKMKTGELTEKDRTDMRKVVDILERKNADILKRQADYFAESVAPEVYGIDPMTAKKFVFSPEAMRDLAPKEESPKGPISRNVGSTPKKAAGKKKESEEEEYKRLKEQYGK